MQDNKLYIAFAITNSGMGRLIRRVTHYRYNHVVLSFSKDLKCMYSFARYNYDCPLVGGFIEESPLRYFYSDGTCAGIKVCEIPLSDEQYKQVQDYIESIRKNSSQYIYNTFSAILSPAARRVKVPKAYTCVEFVSGLIGKLGICPEIQPDRFCTIEELDKQLEGFRIYEGPISGIAHADGWNADQYEKKNGVFRICWGTMKHFGKLIHRAVHA